MIYDCFTFFNEFDLLEIRLNELRAVVDRFVLVEATKTFQQKRKPLFFNENRQRFHAYLPKIEHVVVDTYPTFFSRFRRPTAGDIEKAQRNAIVRGLTKCQPEDTIMVSDVDEIPNPAKIMESRGAPGYKVLRQQFFYYYLNCVVVESDEPSEIFNGRQTWNGPVMCQYKDFPGAQKLRDLRNSRGPAITPVDDGGWHFSYLGGTPKIVEKLEAFAHVEFNTAFYKDAGRIEALIKSGKDLFGRNSYKMHVVSPDTVGGPYLQANLEKYRHLCISAPSPES